MILIKLNRFLIITFFVFISVQLYSSKSYAALSLTEVMPLAFGVLAIPSSTSFITLSETSGVLSGTATILKDTSSRGQYSIMGDQNQTITLDIQNVNTGSAALTLDNFRGMYDGQTITSFPASTLSLPPSTSKILYLGARLQFTPTVVEQTYNMTFDLVVNYD